MTCLDNICGLPGDSDVGYCTCIQPADHEGYHGCKHGLWY